MTREWFKKWWSNIIPSEVERVTYLLFSSIIIGIIIWLWQPINIIVWDFRGAAAAIFLQSLSILGLFIIGVSVFSLSASDLSGWKQIHISKNEIIA